MDKEPTPADSHHRLLSLKEKFRDKQYRDGYVASHTRTVLAQQMRNFRGELSQMSFADEINEQKTMIARLENPAYSGWSLRTMLKIARKLNVAVFVRFVDFPTFLKHSSDLSDQALRPAPYDQEAIDALAEKEQQGAREMEIRELFTSLPSDIGSNETDKTNLFSLGPVKPDKAQSEPPLRLGQRRQNIDFEFHLRQQDEPLHARL